MREEEDQESHKTPDDTPPPSFTGTERMSEGDYSQEGDSSELITHESVTVGGDADPLAAPFSPDQLGVALLGETTKLPAKSTGAKNVIAQHNQEDLAKYPTEVYQYPKTGGGDANSCISSITELPDILSSKSMYPSLESLMQIEDKEEPASAAAMLSTVQEGDDEETDGAHKSRISSGGGTLTSSSTAGRSHTVKLEQVPKETAPPQDDDGIHDIQTIVAEEDHTLGGSTLTPASGVTPANSVVWRLMERHNQNSTQERMSTEDLLLNNNSGTQEDLQDTPLVSHHDHKKKSDTFPAGQPPQSVVSELSSIYAGLSAESPSSLSLTTASKGTSTHHTGSSSSTGYAFVPPPNSATSPDIVPQAPVSSKASITSHATTGSNTASAMTSKNPKSLTVVQEEYHHNLLSYHPDTRSVGSNPVDEPSVATYRSHGSNSTPGASHVDSLNSMEHRVQVKVAGAFSASGEDDAAAKVKKAMKESMNHNNIIPTKTTIGMALAANAPPAIPDEQKQPMTTNKALDANDSPPLGTTDPVDMDGKVNALNGTVQGSSDAVDQQQQQQRAPRLPVGLPLAQSNRPSASMADPEAGNNVVTTTSGDVPESGGDNNDGNDDGDASLARATPVDQPDLQVAESMDSRRDKTHGVELWGGCVVPTLALYIAASIACGGLFAIGVAILVAVIQQDNSAAADESLSSADYALRTKAGDEIKIHLEAVLGQDFFPVDPTGIQPETTAFDWLIYEDPLQMNRTAPNLLQRFLVVYFYMIMTEEGPWKNCNPPDKNQSRHTNVDLCYYEGLLGDGVHPEKTAYRYTVFFSHYDEILATRWLTGSHECHWAGLFCDQEKNIAAIHLDDMQLNGTLPIEIAHLESLTSLSLANNQLSGPLPSELGSVKGLTYMDLNFNQFTGEFPEEWWDLKGLRHLNLGFNALQMGRLPAEVGDLSKLEFLRLDGSGVTGTLPKELFELTKLDWLILQYNALTGTLPTEVGLLHENLQFFGVGFNNELVGMIPTEVALMTSLVELGMSKCSFSGTVPEELLFGLTQLNGWFLDYNRLTGTISTNFAQLTSLSYLLLSHNPITGTVPTELGLLSVLQRVDLDDTDLMGTMPDELCFLRAPHSLSKLKADCEPLSNGFIPMECPAQCCTKCCNQESGTCTKTTA
ncbi:leucine Rich Repeat [Seminavis robusta]|uniref:Leucine Rich Repeat n=1 Tax=Seminavis robusta TaxID=568900 RepID=A0A9N8D9A3_9STRA|nr:leucine Rich Repeat [Seminavis robusta]|eukprot:Sro21_g014870.1 leucine Rich Repeat (1152) ;mRNA; f:123250-126979